MLIRVFLPALKLAVCAAIFTPNVGFAQMQSASSSWHSSYSNPNVVERNSRFSQALEREKLNSGYYKPAETNVTNNVTTTTNYDHSVGDVSLDAAAGASIDFQPRTGEDSGTNSYTVGSVNTTTNDISVRGDGNTLDTTSFADNTGCQDGSISTGAGSTVGGMNISSATSAAAGGGC